MGCPHLTATERESILDLSTNFAKRDRRVIFQDMNNLKRREELKEEEYQGIFGVTKTTFDKMLSILEEAYKRQHSKGGSPLKRLAYLFWIS